MSSSYHVIRFEGVLDISRYPEFRRAFEEAPLSVPTLVDLTAAQSADSTVFTELLLAKRRHATAFAIAIAPLGHLARLFEITGLDEKLGVYRDRSDAVASLGAIEQMASPEATGPQADAGTDA